MACLLHRKKTGSWERSDNWPKTGRVYKSFYSPLATFYKDDILSFVTHSVSILRLLCLLYPISYIVESRQETKTSRIGQSEQGSQNRRARVGQPEQDRQINTARTEPQEQWSQNKKSQNNEARTIQPQQDSHDWTVRPGQVEQECQNWAAMKGLSGQDSGVEQSEQDS
jgi:hypothetical protein